MNDDWLKLSLTDRFDIKKAGVNIGSIDGKLVYFDVLVAGNCFM